MCEMLRGLYASGKLTETQLTKAVKKGWITEEQKEKIMEG